MTFPLDTRLANQYFVCWRELLITPVNNISAPRNAPMSRAGSGSHETRARKKAEKAARARKRRRARAAIWISAAAVVVLITGLAFGLGGRRERQLHDLSAVGRGVPSVVQVHDVTCPICTELRGNVMSAYRGFSEEDLVVRVADIATDEGLAFAATHTVERRRTLLFFDGNGNLLDVQSGLQEVDALRQAFEEHAARE